MTHHFSRHMIIATLLLLAVAVWAPGQTLDSLLERGSFSRAEREEIAELIATSEAAGIPRELLLPRLAEAVAKRVPAPRVLASLRAEASSLLDARAFMREIDADALLTESANWARVANLLKSEVGDPSLVSLARASASRPETFRPASALLLSLVEWGLDEKEAAALAAAASRSEIDPSDYPVVVDVLTEGRISRIPLAEVAERLLETLPDATSARDLRRSVLR